MTGAYKRFFKALGGALHTDVSDNHWAFVDYCLLLLAQSGQNSKKIKALILYYDLDGLKEAGRSLKAVGKIIGLSGTSVRQYHCKAFRILRGKLYKQRLLTFGPYNWYRGARFERRYYPIDLARHQLFFFGHTQRLDAKRRAKEKMEWEFKRLEKEREDKKALEIRQRQIEFKMQDGKHTRILRAEMSREIVMKTKALKKMGFKFLIYKDSTEILVRIKKNSDLSYATHFHNDAELVDKVGKFVLETWDEIRSQPWITQN